MKINAIIAAFCMIASCQAETAEYGTRLGNLKPIHLLKSYNGFVNDFDRTGDAYKMEYHVGDSYRIEERTDSGEVTGAFAFVAPEGNEYEFKYEADSEGFRVEGDALPVQPDYTDDVKARDAFFEAYEKQAELTKDYEYDSESDESDSNEESSEESSEEGSDEESSEEESSEEDDDEEEEEEEEEAQSSQGSSSFFSVPYPYSRRS